MFVVLLTLALLGTATLSGALGMGGGILLMALLAAALPAPAAVALHGAIQLGTNVTRAALLRREIDRPTLARYALGSSLSVLVFAGLAIVVDQTALFLGLGVVAVGATLLRRYANPKLVARFSLRSPAVGVICGALVTSAHLLAGAAGPLLDVFFLETPLRRQAGVATKAATQTLSHALKIAYLVALAPAALSAAQLPLWGYAPLAAAGLCGTALGTGLLERLSEARFRRLTQSLVLALGLFYLGRGLWDLSAW
jgi:uncharacterized membrane protein YfcA